MRFRARLAASPSVKRAANGRVTDSGFKKKAMTTTNFKTEATAPANVRPSSVSKISERVAVDNAKRELPTQTVLELLKAQLPNQYELAEIVGKWIWLDFPAPRPTAAANTLWRLGFHWSQRRCLWQQPCGACAPYFVHSGDPRKKFGSRSVSTLYT